ncbi:histidine kinase [Mobiluncus curtisii]|nr:histidine kinase [Mobiluncus curtisii]NMW47443.1 histidine kinase [Mobiluncus curtisii]
MRRVSGWSQFLAAGVCWLGVDAASGFPIAACTTAGATIISQVLL